jgi:predicted nucleotidyltransferase
MSDAVNTPWAVTPEKVEQAVRRLVEAGRPRKVILFGSYVRGETHRDSDLDVLVVVDDGVEDPLREGVRLRSLLRGIRMLMDIIVVRESTFNQLRDRIGLIYREVTRHGRLVYESPS